MRVNRYHGGTFGGVGPVAAPRGLRVALAALRAMIATFAPQFGVLFGGASHMTQLEATITEVLQSFGGTRAELITTTGRGYRADGTRHPHSWSIVDQRDLAQWVVVQLESR